MENTLQLLKPRNFGDVINDTLGFVKINARPMLLVVLYLVLPLLIFGAYFYSRYFSTIMSVMGNRDPLATTRAIGGSALNIFFGVVGLMLAGIFLYLMVVESFLKYEQTGTLTSSDIFDGIKKDFWVFIGFIFAFGAVAMIAMMVLIGAVAAISFAGGAPLAVIAGIGLFIAFFYLTITLAFTPFIYLRERNGIMNAFSRSFYLIKGHWWQTMAIIFVVYMIVYIASLIFVIPFYALFFTGVMHGIKNGGQPSFEMGAWGTVSMMFMFCGMTIMSSLIHICVIIQYYSLTERKDGLSIMQQIEDLNLPETPGV